MAKRLIFLGPPGAGKGTQAAALSEKMGIPHISTGDIFRAAISSQTPLGMKAQSYMDKGDLVPDDVVVGMIRDRLSESDTQPGWLLDGFPRTLPQANALDELLQDIEQSYDTVLSLLVPDELLIERMLSRGRKDDTEEVIRRRLEVYQEQTSPLIEYYKDRSALQEIEGTGEVEEVTQRIESHCSTI